VAVPGGFTARVGLNYAEPPFSPSKRAY
jgi:hypothetical protein